MIQINLNLKFHSRGLSCLASCNKTSQRADNDLSDILQRLDREIEKEKIEKERLSGTD